MALNDVERKRIENEIAAFVEKRRPPKHLRDEVDLAFRFDGRSVELFEIRPRGNKPAEKIEEAIAKARYFESRGEVESSRVRVLISVIGLLLVTMTFAGCSKEEPPMPSPNPSVSSSDFVQTAVEFTKLLAARKYPEAHAMTSQEYRRSNSVDQLRTAFEAIVPADWGSMGPIEAGQTMTSWPEKLPADIGWVYVTIGGNVYSEAVTVVVTSENGVAKIRDVQFGRP